MSYAVKLSFWVWHGKVPHNNFTELNYIMALIGVHLSRVGILLMCDASVIKVPYSILASYP